MSFPTHTPSLREQELQYLVELQQKDLSVLKRKLEECKSRIDFSHFKAIVKELKDEQEAHRRTKEKLCDCEEQLEFARNEIQALRKQIQNDKQHYEKSLTSLQKQTLKEAKKSVELENQCNLMSLVVEQRKDQVHRREKHIQDLSEALHDTRATFGKRLNDALIAHEHERYIAKVLNSYPEDNPVSKLPSTASPNRQTHSNKTDAVKKTDISQRNVNDNCSKKKYDRDTDLKNVKITDTTTVFRNNKQSTSGQALANLKIVQ